MKKQREPKKQTNESAELSFYPAVPRSVADEAFKKAVKPANGGANTYLEIFLLVAQRITENSRSFSFQDFIYHAKPYEVSVSEIKRLFEAWTEKMIQLNKLSAIQGCYDDEVFIVI